MGDEFTDIPFKYTNVFARNHSAKKRVLINIGGKGSSKSYSIAQNLICKMVTEKNKVFCISRKTLPALRLTAMQLFFDLLIEYQVYDEKYHNKTFNTYLYDTNRVNFIGLDEEQKARSMEFNYGWMEESNEYEYKDYTTFKLQLRRPETDDNPNQLFLSLNPTDENGWIPQRAVKEEDVQVIHSTFKDNPFLSPAYVKSLTDLINYDQNAYRVYCLGEWGRVEGRIFTNYKRIAELPDMTGAKWAYGVDFGAVHPSTIVKGYIKDDKFYAEEKFYKAGATYSDIIEALSHEERGDIYCDPSSTQAILELCGAGYFAMAAHRDVKDRIDLCQRQTIYIPENSPNLLKEIAAYCWRKDPGNSERYLPEPVKYNDDAIDSMLYVLFGLAEHYGFATQRPKVIKPIQTLHFAETGPIKWR